MAYLLVAVRVAMIVAGAFLVAGVVASSIRTVILPRAVPSRITRAVFLLLRVVFDFRVGRGATYERRDRVMANYGPVSLLALLVTWEVLILVGYGAIYWALGHSLVEAFALSGSSIVTLGFAAPRGLGSTAVVITEGLIGLVELALLITYLPTMYAAFQRREALVTKLEVRAGAPPSGVEMLKRFERLSTLGGLAGEVWEQWEDWFVDLEESHTSLPALNFFRSPHPQRSWITAAGAVLDGASLYASTLAVEHDRHADLCIRAGYLALRHVCQFFRLPFNPAPSPDDPISIAREEFDAAYEELRAAGLPMRPDRDAAWRAFSGWRVNYDDTLLAMAALVSAPYAPWSSDRGVVRRPSTLRALVGF